MARTPTAYEHVLIGTVSSGINNRLYSIQRCVSLADSDLSWFSIGYMKSLTGNDPRASSSSAETGTRRSNFLGGTVLAGGMTTSSKTWRKYEAGWEEQTLKR